MSSDTVFHLAPGVFGEKEKPLVEFPGVQVSGFRFGSGVCAVRLRNSRGEIVALPFQGQQIGADVAGHGGR